MATLQRFPFVNVVGFEIVFGTRWGNPRTVCQPFRYPRGRQELKFIGYRQKIVSGIREEEFLEGFVYDFGFFEKFFLTFQLE